jgi:DNA polymerase III epsilon subunit-like protein
MFKFQHYFHAREFHLIENHRSTANIVRFFSGFRSLVFNDIVPTRPEGKPVKILIRTRRVLYKWLVAVLRAERRRHEVAIICPTKGTGAVKDVGLSAIVNLLHSNGIPFTKHYDEFPGDEAQAQRRGIVPGRVNLITYTGTKGLEFRKVILMDFHSMLLNRIPTSLNEYWEQRNLLYVACSRARDEMVICAHRDIHPWITKIDPVTYVCDSGPVRGAAFPLARPGRPQPITNICDIVDRLRPEALDDIYSLMNVRVVETRILKDRSDLPRGDDDALLAAFTRELMIMQMSEHAGTPRKLYPEIEALLQSNFVILPDREHYMLRSFLGRNRGIGWREFFERSDTFDQEIRDLVLRHFNRDIEFSANVITSNEAKTIIERNRDSIERHYKHYCDSPDWITAFNDLFYIVIVQLALNTGHYYHMNNGGVGKLGIIQSFIGMFSELDRISRRMVDRGGEVKMGVQYGWKQLGITGMSDMSVGGALIDIRCGSELYIKHYIQLLLANFCHKNTLTSRSHVINPVRGADYSVELAVSSGDMFRILNIIADQCNLRFTNMHVVFDLETSGLIKTVSGREVMPEIVQIAMREYETGLLMYNHHVRPREPLSDTISKLIRISNEQLRDKPDITRTKMWLARQLRNVDSMVMYAHNGLRFDARIMEHYQMIAPSVKIEWRDTIPIIRGHFGGQLESGKLGSIYEVLFGRSIELQHTALADVDALIRIMRHLQVRLESKKLIDLSPP